MECVEIAGREIGDGAPCFVIAEMGLAHDGSLGAAYAFIDAVAGAGADAVKFQAHIASAEGTAEEQFRTRVFPQDETRQDYWERTAFSSDQWQALKLHAERKGLVFLCSPFSLEAADMLSDIGIAAWKIAAGETSNIPLIDKLAQTGTPVLVSTGMSRSDEVDLVIERLLAHDAPVVLFQCTSRYPCPPEHMGFNMLAEYRERYHIPVAFSDHSGKVASGLAAVVLGACAVEVHVTFSRDCFGPDVCASLTVSEFRDLVGGIRFLEDALKAPVDKDRESESLSDIRGLFTKSIVAGCDLENGALLAAGNLAFKKPGVGIPSSELNQVVGKVLKVSVPKDHILKWSDFEDE
jgi:N,N'-diacetyllegionaminate synthase